MTEGLLCVRLRAGASSSSDHPASAWGVNSLVSLLRKLALPGGLLAGYLGDDRFEWGAWQCPWQGDLDSIVQFLLNLLI